MRIKLFKVNRNLNRTNLQIISSLTGIKQYKNIIKIRNDQRYTHESMINMYNFYQYKTKINILL